MNAPNTNNNQDNEKRMERERKKAEVRARLEAAAASKKKKGFMTPERKKKLRLLLRKKAAEELKRQQEIRASERKRVISQRMGQMKPLDGMSDDQLIELARQYHGRINQLEEEKYNLEYAVSRKDYEISELAAKVNDMRGKFIRPPLKRIPKYEAKIERMLLNARKEIGFTVAALKSVKKEQMSETKEPKKAQPPEWSWKQRSQTAAGATNKTGLK